MKAFKYLILVQQTLFVLSIQSPTPHYNNVSSNIGVASLLRNNSSAQQETTSELQPILSKSRQLKILEFTQMFFSEVPSDFGLYSENDLPSASYWWDKATVFQWEVYFRIEAEQNVTSPFIICSTKAFHSGMERRAQLESAIQKAELRKSKSIKLLAIYNQDEMSCYMTDMYTSTALNVKAEDGLSIVVHPMMMQMKMPEGTVHLIQTLYQEWHNYRADSKNGRKDEAKSVKPPRLEGGMRRRRRMTENITSSRDMTTASADVTLCPGAAMDFFTNMRDARNLTEMNQALFQNLTAYLQSVDPESNKPAVLESFFWTNTKQSISRSQKSLVNNGGTFHFTPPARAEFWSILIKDHLNNMDVLCNRNPPTGQTFSVTIQPPVDSENCTLCTTKLKVEVSLDSSNQACILSVLVGLALHPSACTLEVRPSNRQTFDLQAQWLMQTGVEDLTPWYDVGLTGEGQIVAVSDTGLDVDNCYFWDSKSIVEFDGEYKLKNRKVVQYVPFADRKDTELGHGTHVCGIIAGQRADDGTTVSKGNGDGIAYGAKISFFDMAGTNGRLKVSPKLLQTGRPHANIHSMSWGSPGVNFYGLDARMMDEYMYENINFLIVSAAGNSGSGDTFNTVSDPATAKNSISVGSSESYGKDLVLGQLGPRFVSSFSSKGPTSDGRTKPDVVAPGHYILSAGARPEMIGECDPLFKPMAGQSKEGLTSMAGTSMAAPAVSGAAALVRQYFESGFYPSGTKKVADKMIPTSALVKAVLLNGAQAMSGVNNGDKKIYPTRPYDDVQNYGRVSLIDSLYIQGKSNIQAKVWDQIILPSNSSMEYNVTFDTSGGCKSKTISATLAWTDPPGAVSCRRCLLNDFDLSAVKNGNRSEVYFPNGLHAKDDVNNVERIQITDMINGDYLTFEVRAHNLDTEISRAALVITGCFGGAVNELDLSKSVYMSSKTGLFPTFGWNFFTVAIIAAVCAFFVGVFCCLRCCSKRKPKSSHSE